MALRQGIRTKNNSASGERYRIGVKPLYFYHKDGRFIFASRSKRSYSIRQSRLTSSNMLITIFGISNDCKLTTSFPGTFTKPSLVIC